MTSEDIILHTNLIFARHGISEVVISDNGPQFASKLYAKFAWQYRFKHITTSSHYPKSNGETEKPVKTVKSLLRKSEDPT